MTKETIFRNCALRLYVRKWTSRKILKVHEIVTELKSSVNTLHEKFQHRYQPKDVETSGKRKLSTPDPLTVALVHSTKLNQIAFVLHQVLRVVCLELNRNLRIKKCLFSSDTKDYLTGQLSSGNSTATVLQTTWMYMY